MPESLSDRYTELLSGSYDCTDRIVLNAYFRMGHTPGGFRVWWGTLTGSEETLDNAHLMRMAGRFSRRLHGYAKAEGIPLVHCQAGEHKHELAEEYLTKTQITEGLFLILVGRAQAPVWDVTTNHHHIEPKRPMPYVNHYSFHILDPEWGHLTIKISGHPPFPAQVILNGHEYVACQAAKAGIRFAKEGNCFTQISDAASLAGIADTLSGQQAIGRLQSVCERWIYSSCLCFALELEEQKRSGFHYQYSNYQVEYSRNLIFSSGREMDSMLEELPAPSSVGKTKVGGIDLNKARMRLVVEALIALGVSPSARGFTASELARQVRLLSNQTESDYGPRRGAYDLKKLRAKNIVQRIAQTRRYESTASGLRAMVALVVLRNKAIKPLLAAAQRRRKSRGAQNPRPIDRHYETIRVAMQGVFDELGLAA